MKIKSTERYFLFILLSVAIILTIIIIYPFLTMFVLAAAFAVVLGPLYEWINKNLVRNISWIASLLTIIIFLLGLCVPLFFVGKSIFTQTQNVYSSIMDSNSPSVIISNLNNSIDRWLPAGFEFDVNAKISEMINSISGNLAHFFSSTFHSIFMFVLMVFSLFYLLKDGKQWKDGLISLLPLSDENTKEILSTLKKSINRIFRGSFIIAIAQGLLAWIGLTIFGVPNAVLWAVVASIASFVPTVGTSIVSVPAMIFLFFMGHEWQALGLLIWSMAIIGTVDNILSPYIISKDTEMPSLFILFAILGGISIFGPLGIIIGPLVISFLYSLVSIYKKELKD